MPLPTRQLNDGVISYLKPLPKAPTDKVILFDRDEEQLAVLSWDDIEISETESLDGEYYISVEYPAGSIGADLIQEDFFLALGDVDRNWQLFEIKRLHKIKNKSGEFLRAYCEHIYYDLATEEALSKSFESATAEEAALEILAGTRLQLGLVSDLGQRSFSFQDLNPLQALRRIESVYDCELRFRVIITGKNSFTLLVDILPQRGRFTGLRYEFGHNLDGIDIEVNTDNIVTALKGRGQGTEIDPETGEAERIDFKDYVWQESLGDPTDKPDGQDWVGDEEARLLYGKPDGNGGRKHIFDVYESQAQSQETLIMQTWLQVQNRKAPLLNVKADSASLEKITGRSHEKDRLGDTVYILAPKLKAELEARIIRTNRDRKNHAVKKIEFGNFLRLASDSNLEIRESVRVANSKQRVHDRAGLFEPAFEEIEEGYYKLSKVLIGTDGIFQGKLVGGTLYVPDEENPLFSVTADGKMTVIDGEFSGNVRVGGDIVIGGDGLLSVFQYVSADTPREGGPAQGWSDFGLVFSGGTIFVGTCSLTVPVPSNFVMTKATITLEAMPTFYEDLIYPVNTAWKQSRNLKLYTAEGDEGFHDYPVPSADAYVIWRSQTDITNAILGAATWSPTLNYSGDDRTNTQNKIDSISGDISSYLTPGDETTFRVETTDVASEANYENNQGLGRIVVIIEGFAKPE